MLMERRSFLVKSCACLGGLTVLKNAGLWAQSGVVKVSMADLTAQHLTQGFWSADSLFLSAIKFLKQPEDLVRVSMPFGGGMGQDDLCGYVTGGYMSIGLFAGPKKGDDMKAREKCMGLAKEYHEWWITNYPIHCREIKEKNAGHCDYKMMGQKASEFLQKMFEREMAAK